MAASYLLLAMCVYFVSQSLASFWDCAPCEEVDCPRLFCDESVQVLDPVCGCCPVCLRKEFQRCGGVKRLQCGEGLVCSYRLGNVFEEDRTGMCESKQCTTKVCGYRQYCNATLVDGAYNLTCHCPEVYAFRTKKKGKRVKLYCHKKNRPVCGNDGVTYNSRCHLHRHECESNSFVGINHEGKCQTYTVDEGPTDTGIFRDNKVIPQQELVPAMGLARSCEYYGQVYQPNTINSIPEDPCRYIVCNAYSVLSIVPVPGCPGNPPEIWDEYHYDSEPIVGGWSHWSGWSTCVGGCYNGTQTRTRTCTYPPPLFEGKECKGISEQSRKCFPERCNISCDYTRWTPWAKCSASCIGGITTRNRSITNVQDEEVTRKACHLFEQKTCNVGRNCPVTTGNCKPRLLGSNVASFDRIYFQVHVTPWKRTFNCYTIDKWESYYCGGECKGNGTECCKPVEWNLLRHKYSDCGWWFYLHVDVPVVTKCGCVNDGVPPPIVYLNY